MEVFRESKRVQRKCLERAGEGGIEKVLEAKRSMTAST